MSKSVISAYIDVATKEAIEKMAYKDNIKVSSLVGYILREYVKEKNLVNYEMVECGICESKYSSKLNKCPNCEANEQMRIREEEEQIKSKKKHLEEMFNRLIDRRTQLIEWLQQGKATQEEVNDIENEVKNIKEKLNNMNKDTTDVEQ